MDRRLLRYYEQELGHLQGMAREFAREHPKIAARLAIDDLREECVDPYVERLLEGFAFLAARVQLKLDAEFPRFTQNLLQAVFPHYLAPTPSMCVVEFTPDYGDAELAGGYSLPRGSTLRSIIGKGDRTTCDYRSAHDVLLYPMRLTQAQYYTRDVGVLNLGSVASPAGTVRGAMRIRLAATAGLTMSRLQLDRLVLNFRGETRVAGRIYEQIFGHCRGVIVRSVPEAGSRVSAYAQFFDPSSVERVGFEEDEALLPYDSRSFQGYRLLQEYFAFPQRFLFAAVTGLRSALVHCETSEMDLVFLFDQEKPELENVVETGHVGLYCTPAVNLFPKRADRIFITERFSELQVIPDRTRPLDFEVYSVTSVTGIGAQAEDQTVFRPFYAARDTDSGGASTGAYFAVNRVPRTMTEREQRAGRRTTSYGGSDVYLSLVDAANAPYSEDIRQLSIETMCTNRDLPIHIVLGNMDTHFTLDVGAPVSATRVMAGPTAPRASHVDARPGQSEGDLSWRLISHLSLNYLSICDTTSSAGGSSGPAEGAAALRDILRLYSDRGDPSMRKQVDGVKSVRVEPITRRITTPGPIVFGRGLEVGIVLDQANFEGGSGFVLGAVLDHFFARYVSMNSFTETVIYSAGREELMRWPARMGRRSLL